MARGVRKTALEKLQIELADTKNSIKQYEEMLDTLKEQETNLLQQIELEEFKSLKSTMEEFGLSLDEVKELIILQSEVKQSA